MTTAGIACFTRTAITHARHAHRLPHQAPPKEQLIELSALAIFTRPRKARRVHEDTEPLRSELLSIEQLKRHAAALAAKQRVDPRPGPDLLLARLAENAQILEDAYDLVTTAASLGQPIAPAESWLLDNFYLIEQQIGLARRHLPRGYGRQLPRLTNGPAEGFPRIYELALDLISHMDGRVDNDNATQFLAEFQTVQQLQLGELWAFPIMLQLALVENLRRVGLRIAQRRQERDAASAWADRMLAAATSEPQKLIQLLAQFAQADVPLTASFVEEFYARLQAQGPAMAFVQAWVEHKLREQGVTAAALSEAASRTAAANQLSIANSIGSLRFIGTADWTQYVESLSAVEQTLRTDPRDAYAHQDIPTRDRYRHAVEDVARRSPCSELEVAQHAVALSRAAAEEHGALHRSAHVGYFLIDRGRRTLERAVGFRESPGSIVRRALRRARFALYVGPIALVSLGLTAAFVWRYSAGHPYAIWLLLVPLLIAASSLSVSLVNSLVTQCCPPRRLPRLDFSKGIPDGHRTMVIVPTLLASTADVDSLLEAMEIRYLGNRDTNLYFALLTDLPDAREETLLGDPHLIAYARAGVEELNAEYCDDRRSVFYLFHRPRKWNPFEGVWMGYERKRGKLEQFNAHLRGAAKDAFSEIVGDTSILPSIQYVITLDTDTQLPRDAARMLVGNLAHPLNRPVYDAKLGRIVEGYAILQPRASISMTSAGHSRFARLFAGESGIDPYTREVSDVYQDVFGEGTFIGKGIYDVDAFRLAIEGRLPENLVLSHDLLESGYARSALVTDVELIEEHPSSVAVEASRRHRWIRGDWQLAGWLLGRVPGPPGPNGTRSRTRSNPLSALSLWKLFDNLRRSLLAPALLAVLVVGWFLGPPWIWGATVLTVLGAPALLSLAIDLGRKPRDRDWMLHLNQARRSMGQPIAQSLLHLSFLPYDAMIAVSAVARSGLRMLFTRRGLLLWQLPAYTRRNARRTLVAFFREMWIAPVMALVLLAVLATRDLSSIEWGHVAPILFLWLLAPSIGWWLSRPLPATSSGLNDAQRRFLRLSARRTWRYFVEFVGAKDNWLPPDNFQEYPTPAIASRTSPTNIGMSLLADLAATDFGYLTIGAGLERIGNTLESVQRLERYRGHLYNWYDTRTLEPLRPQYISSVDSGNLAGSLLALRAGLGEWRNQPIASRRDFLGLLDTLELRMESVASGAPPDLLAALHALEDTLEANAKSPSEHTPDTFRAALQDVRRLSTAVLVSLPSPNELDLESDYWAQAFEQQITALHDEFARLVPALWSEKTMPSRLELANAGELAALADLQTIDEHMARCDELAAMDFSFLFDAPRGLLTIGYDVAERRRDPACYDLLASEARLASFLLIAQGQLPQKHWFALGRLLTSYGGDVSLISWSGSMFEYLMPHLIMPSYPNTLLDHTCKAVVTRQIEYGRQRGVPWGISESCYNATDTHQIYQYRAFGVPGLGFKRGLGDDLVIAPYASALALMVLPKEACTNLQVLAAQGFQGSYGFYEAIDYTPARVPRGKSHGVVRNFMVHHQGMSLLAFAHVLLGQPMQRRFLSDPLVRATELLLQERVPRKGSTIQPHAAEVSAAARPPMADSGSILRVFTDPSSLVPEVHLLSNGRYHVMASHAGGSTSRWRNINITRWREDSTCDNWGTFIYLRDVDSGRYWSAAHQPTLRKADHYEAIFVEARAEYRRRDQGIDAHTEICVSPEDDVEIRRVTLTNRSSRVRHIEVTSYAEVVLAELGADLAHRCFSNLFVQTEILPESQAILCVRRPRTPGEHGPWMFHLLACPGSESDAPSYETDRAKFLGRGRTVQNPLALEGGDGSADLSNSQGSVLDPIVSIRRTLTLRPDATSAVQIVSGVAASREEALALLAKYCDRHFVERAFEMAGFQSRDVLRQINASEADAQVYGRLASSVIYGNSLRRAAPEVLARNQLGQSGLWRFSVSGDLPIVLLHIGDIHRIELVQQVLQAHSYWRMKGVAVDLVIVNDDFSGYRANLQEQIVGLIQSGPGSQFLDKPGGVYLRRSEELTEPERALLLAVARVVFSDAAGSFLEQVERRAAPERPSERLVPIPSASSERHVPSAIRERIFDNGLGGFTPDGREYVISLAAGENTPAPWVNVIASPHIGTVVSESGGAYTWVGNAHEFRLTTWHNDPVCDTSGEALYLRDEESGVYWSPSPLPASGRTGYLCRHGFGYTVFEHCEVGISSELTTYVAMDAPVKFLVVKLRNESTRTRSLSLTGYWELVLGESRPSHLMHIVTESDPGTCAVFARNAYGRECANRVVFAHASGRDRSLSGNRTEFLGRNGTLATPSAMRRRRLSGKTGAGLDPCAAIQSRVELAPGQTAEVVLVFGAARDADEARHFIQRFGGGAGARQALEAVWDHWRHTLGAIQVNTPDPALNAMANGWLLYQTLSCRIWARSGFYQSGGAYGFRDQLQDVMALVQATPTIAREQILRHASRQFPKGDVQHWWHPPGGQGVRTHFSDDYLWLPYAVSRYVQATGDAAVLDELVPFLEGRELYANEEAYYDQPQRSAESASLYEHCVRALKHGLRFGVHHLPLIGCGDWNDGMNFVGRDGKGESVWLAWFLLDNLKRFAVVARGRGDAEFAETCDTQAEQLRGHVEAEAWDGEWYRRAYFDDGTPLGSASNEECQIDSISQSWAVISGAGDPERARRAMLSVDQRLVRRDASLIQLLDPPFDKSSLEPGYIKGYVPGVRENGGQYTHAAIWTAMAFAMLGDRERAWELFTMLNPVHHGGSAARMQRYKVEPYVMCADIYAAAPHTGRGGWTWYTGASGWMYRLIVETLLGLHPEGDHLRIDPCVPAHWDAFTVLYRHRATTYRITVKRASEPGTRVRLDGELHGDNRIPLQDDRREHRVDVELG